MISINRQLPKPLVHQVYDALVAQIGSGERLAGERLPSVRQLAHQCGISTLTVSNAYQRLVAEGRVHARPASGYYVAADQSDPLPRRRPFEVRSSVNALWLLKHVYEDDRSLLNAGCGWISPEMLYGDGVRRAMSSLARKSSLGLANYGSPYGYLPLRQQLQTLLSQRGIKAHAHQIVMTHGAFQALGLIAKCLLKPRDVVLVDDPGSTNFFATLRSMDLKLVGVERLANGPNVVALEVLQKRHKAKAFFTTSNLHNPTGSLISPLVANRVLRLASQLNFVVVDNDAMAGLEPPGTTSLAQLDQLKSVIHVGSFSKTVSPGLRVGFIACDEQIAEKLIVQKMLSSLTTSELNEKILHGVLVEGRFRTHLLRLSQQLQECQKTVRGKLKSAGLQLFNSPAFGPFLWARFSREDVDMRALAQRAIAHGLLLAPGDLFRPDLSPTPWMRFNVTYADAPHLYSFLEHEARTNRR